MSSKQLCLLNIYKHRNPNDIDMAITIGFWQFFRSVGARTSRWSKSCGRA